MGRRLRMTAELGDWLTDLGGSDPATAAEVAAALVAVLDADDPVGLAHLLGPAAADPTDPRERADVAYQQLLEKLQRTRRGVAQIATARMRGQRRLEAERAAGADPAVVAELERQVAAVGRIEEQVTRRSQVLQTRIDGFRTARETAKAVYTAAEASLRIAEIIEATGGEPDPDLAQRREAYLAAEERLRDLPGSARMVGFIRLAADKGIDESGEPSIDTPAEPRFPPPAPAEPALGLLELLADRLGSDARILLAVEPADTVTLLAVLEGAEAVSEHGAEAIRLASELLSEIREDGWPADIDEVALEDSGGFLARFFPADDGSIARRAGVLAAMVPLASLRDEQHLSIAELANRSGVDAHRIESIDRDGLGSAQVHEAVALARALGARLELPGGQGPVAG